MDILRDDSGISPEDWGIRPNLEADGRLSDRAPARFVAGSKVQGAMVAAGCVIEGQVINSMLSPGVRVGKNAVVRDSIILHDCIIEEGACVDLAILDKRVVVGGGAKVGCGDRDAEPNIKYPKHLYTGITLIGKESVIPPETTVGRNCIVEPGHSPDAFASGEVAAGESV